MEKENYYVKKSEKMKSFKNYLNIDEAKQVGIIYHFTSVNNLIGIVRKNVMYSNLGYISFTRNSRLGYNDAEVRIMFDGDKMSNKFKFEPFQHKGAYSYDKDIETIRKSYGGEWEESIKKNKIKDILKYIKRIDILDEIKDYPSDMKKLDDIKKKLSNNIEFVFVKDWKSKITMLKRARK
jgi:hypothetical protein